ncbi:unnamed protein product [Diabrotica balteata]|uniref:Uncharacterized protein n=1 Tax=Diabrotica balteata TaxID=107213 RepID=A0A9N9SUN7_DIABA|nr:unnamed protein product [Diabrotica balteata]
MNNEKWSEIKKDIRTSSTKFLLPDKRKKKDWMTAEILDMMEERRIYKTKDTAKYRETHRQIRAEIRKTKEKWFSEICEEIEQCEKVYDYHNMHKKIKELTTKKKLQYFIERAVR